MRGRLIYRPTPGSDVRMRVMLFRNIVNPETLEGTFDLDGCGDKGAYLSINIGYHKRRIPTNGDKVAIWIAPQFVVERDLADRAAHLAPIMRLWTSPVGLLWMWGGWDSLEYYNYLVTQSFDDLSNGVDLYQKMRLGISTTVPEPVIGKVKAWWYSDWTHARHFTISFVS